jgi:hypothetical protein
MGPATAILIVLVEGVQPTSPNPKTIARNLANEPILILLGMMTNAVFLAWDSWECQIGFIDSR